MDIKVENFKKFKSCGDDLLELVKNKFAITENLELSGAFENNGISYDLWIIETDDWISDGKYEDRSVKYQLVSFDKSKAGYACKASVTDYYNLFLNQYMCRTGSYYSDWSYEYHEPVIEIMKLIDVPEIVIPAHQEIKIEQID